MFEFFTNKNTEKTEYEKLQASLKIRDDLWESFYGKDEKIIKELHKYEFLIETLYKMKNINKIKNFGGPIYEDYTNTELISELGIFNKDEEERLIRWSNKYNELVNKHKHAVEDYNKQINEIKEKLNE